MGRKPNQLILEFFERGQKLQDASNRYEHTCKSCGEKFPKGRIDSLTNHLVKKCPAIPMRDRQRAILQMHSLPDLPDNSSTSQGSPHHGMPVDLPYATKAGMSALETLAEVSRQQLDYNGNRVHHYGNERSERQSSAPEFRLQDFLVQDERSGDDNVADVSVSGNQPPMYHFGANLSATGTSHLQLPSSLPPNCSSDSIESSSLIMAASAANDLQALMPEGSFSAADDHSALSSWINMDNIDPTLQDTLRQRTEPRDHVALNADQSNGKHEAQIASVRPQADMSTQPVQEDVKAQTSALPTSHTADNDEAQQINFTTNFSITQKPHKPKVRGRFTDGRRKEVQEVRKRGACIRCRMLKKPCSEGTPCNTCANVESARLWKQPCIRTRIADEFGLFSAGLHTTLGFHAVNEAKQQVFFEACPSYLEATHFDDPSKSIAFALRRGRAQGQLPIDPAILDGQQVLRDSAGSVDVHIIEGDADDITVKLEQYMKASASAFRDSEPSPFMKSTLSHASALLSDSSNTLLSRALELWTATRLTIDPSLKWQLTCITEAISHDQHVESEHEVLQSSMSERDAIAPAKWPKSQRLIVSQLSAAAEKRAAHLSKFIMNELERKLLQRQQASPFETFLTAVILLAAVEHMCWYFKSWETGPELQPTSALEDVLELSVDDNTQQSQLNQSSVEDHQVLPPSPLLATTTPQGSPPDFLFQMLHSNDFECMSNSHAIDDSSTGFRPQWPLENPPPVFAQQGERFSDVVHMLLKMRGIPPRVTIDPATGTFVVADTPVLHVSKKAKIADPAESNVDGSQAETGSEADPARAWFAEIAVTPYMLLDASSAPFEGRSSQEWDLKFVGKILAAGFGRAGLRNDWVLMDYRTLVQATAVAE